MHFDKTAADEIAWETVMENREDDPNGQESALMLVIVEAIRKYCTETIHL